jgi:glycosyltransferase involved in cell wall biosynthesis
MNIHCKLISSLLSLFFVHNIFSEPLLVVVLMVKNEAAVIEATLQPFVDGGITDFVVFDTGSNDNTPEVATQFFKQYTDVTAHIVQEPFVDFSTSRNRALETVETLFPQATFMLMPDAEWYMHKVEGLVQFCVEHKDDIWASYLVPIRSTAQAFYTSRLIRCRRGIRFVGRVHEALNQISCITLPEDIYFEWRPSSDGCKKSAQRWLRDRDLLLKSYADNPQDPRTLFYLGQTYECLGDWENAYIYYKKRTEIKGWSEEDFVAMYRLGNVACMLKQNYDPQTQMPLAIVHYFAAFSMRPHRAEPLIKIAQYYIDAGNMPLAFLFALRAAQIPYPSQDILPLEKYLYNYVRYDILGICAWYVGEYKVGEWAVKQALRVNPHAEHLLRNLALYTDRRISSSF